MQPGFGSYFARWLEHQEQLWSQEGTKIERKEVDQVLSILAFAYGPLEASDLLNLINVIHQADQFVTEHSLLHPLRRFVLGNGKPGHGYVLSHPKIGEYLQRERFSARSKALQAGFAKWGQDHLMALNVGRMRPNGASPYALQYLHKHLEDGNKSSKEWMELVENGRRCAWEHFEGVSRGFASDVQAASNVVHREELSVAIGDK
jgi:hypothetical protein